ncbi:MAG: NAD(P)H-dependent oxidoreductase [Flavobacteriales bacterium]|nr:NAD(P)H-dependent oxidoreductase [Flavobacteriales bacterium]
MSKVIAFSGSNSSKSINQTLVRIVAPLFETSEVEILNIRDFSAPIYGIDEEEQNGFPASMIQFKKKMDSADGYLISVPEHNGSMPAAFKSLLDWLSRMGGKIFQEKPVLFLGTSPGGRGAASVLKHIQDIMPYRGAKIVGIYGVSNFHDKISNDELIDQDDLTNIKTLITDLENAI